MIRCRLSTLMGQRKLKVADVVRATGVPRTTVTALYKETAERIDLDSIEALCRYFECDVGDLLQREASER
jgi:putative transcriptional regulator